MCRKTADFLLGGVSDLMSNALLSICAGTSEDDSVERRFVEPLAGLNLSIITTVSASYTVFPVERPDENQSAVDTDEVAEAGAYFAGGLGILSDIR